VCVGAVFVGAACRTTEPMPDFDETPAIALLITPELPPLPPRPPGARPPPDSGLYATLVTTGTPVNSPYLRADRFEMRRVPDGARFAWRPFPVEREVVGFFPPQLGNYFLPKQPSAAGLGSDSIAPGGVYDLAIDAGQYRLVGRTRVPDRVEFVREDADGDSIVRWRRTPGAAYFQIGGGCFGGCRPIADTALVITSRVAQFPGEPPLREFVRVFAFDTNVALSVSDLRVSQAGISGGWGIFGSFTWADMELPPPAASR
jgi:hypothetical protein